VKPIAQSKSGLLGDCFPSCIASIMELSLSEVPHFFAVEPREDHMWTQEHWDAVRKFSHEHVCQACWLDPDVEKDKQLIQMLESSDLYYIAFGQSHTGNFGHCVVMHRGKYVHDPAGCLFLASEPWLYVLFEPLGNAPIDKLAKDTNDENT
jgi:hypothetical protein